MIKNIGTYEKGCGIMEINSRLSKIIDYMRSPAEELFFLYYNLFLFVGIVVTSQYLDTYLNIISTFSNLTSVRHSSLN